MKNFKLLLATTAILSTGAILTSFAGTIDNYELSANIEILANIIVPDTIKSVEDLSFGTMIPHAGYGSGGGAILSPSGTISADLEQYSTDFTFLGDHKVGKIEVYTNLNSGRMQIVSPSESETVILTSDNGDEVEVHSINFVHNSSEDIIYDDGYALQTYYMGATLEATILNNGSFKGTYTVTLVEAD